jgi:Protein of unknown function (DUF3455)
MSCRKRTIDHRAVGDDCILQARALNQEIVMWQKIGLLGLYQVVILGIASAAFAQSPLPEAISAPGETVVLTAYAEGAQVYDCKVDAAGKLAWTFREPIATLLLDGRTIGRHYAGPHWELTDGSTVQGKVSGRAPGATAGDIPWLKLDVIARKGQGQLDGVTTVQRINTKGGALEGSCDKAGTFRSVAYSTDYVYLKK